MWHAYLEEVRKKGLTGGLDAGINFALGGMFDYSGPMLWIAQFFHDGATPPEKLLGALDGVVELRARLAAQGHAIDRVVLHLHNYRLVCAVAGT